jgi:serine/threonine protein kinase/tetratricopeptide (TPR) repeat protein
VAVPNPAEQAIFNAARLIEAPDARHRYVEQACAEDGELRARVEALLRVYEEDPTFLQSPAEEVPAGFDDPACEAPGTAVGPYRLIQQLGEGGMGTVFLAEQAQPVRRRVALKLITPGLDCRQVIVRFEAERQALALMDHPNIAKVFDAGSTPAGRPYFVMELVNGLPLTDYCDQHRLMPRQRLALFLAVCQGVQHAHQKGVIHRDLKPSNVLVAEYDGWPVPKIIDFGIAKATGHRLTEQTLVTRVGMVIGTVEYMSPEQAEPDQPDIDTRSDVYSLGVLLYELLTGTTPLRRPPAGDVALFELLRQVREEEPPRPSARLGMTDGLEAIAAKRGLEPKRLRGQVQGDLDWIVMRCLEKDRKRRYETADALARDIERYLRDEPVEARPPSRGYRLHKFARRHKGLLATAAAFVLLLLGGAAVSAWQAVRATTAEGRARDNEQKAVAERDQKEMARRQARQALNKLTDETVERLMARQTRLTKGDREYLRQILALHAEFAADQGDSPESRAGVADAQFRIGLIHSKLGENKEAEEANRAARDIRQQLAAEFPAEPDYRYALGESHHNLGNLLRETGEPQQAEQAFRAARELFQQLAAEYPGRPDYRRRVANGHIGLGLLLLTTNRLQPAEEEWQAGVDVLRQLASEYPRVPDYRSERAHCHNNLGNLFALTNRPEKAEESYRAARDLQLQLVADFPDEPDYRSGLAAGHSNLSGLLRQTKRPREAEAASRAALALQAQLVADFPGVPQYRHELVAIHVNLANLLRQTGRTQEAEEAYGAARDNAARLATDFPAVPDYQDAMAATLGNLAVLKLAGKDHAAARKLLEQALLFHRASLKANPRNPHYLQEYHTNLNRLVLALAGLGDHAKLAEAAEQIARCGDDAAGDAYDAACALSLGVSLAAGDAALTEAKRKQVAQTYADRALALLREAVGHGWKDAAHMKKDTDLDPLRTRDDFQKLIRDLEAGPGGP